MPTDRIHLWFDNNNYHIGESQKMIKNRNGFGVSGNCFEKTSPSEDIMYSIFRLDLTQNEF